MNTLNFFVYDYPAKGNDSPFIEDEILLLSKIFKKVNIIPLKMVSVGVDEFILDIVLVKMPNYLRWVDSRGFGLPFVTIIPMVQLIMISNLFIFQNMLCQSEERILIKSLAMEHFC